ncbi:MAG: TraR/DksA family transcriptional regulator [Candidatus Moraniibacteriota bacterium]
MTELARLGKSLEERKKELNEEMNRVKDSLRSTEKESDPNMGGTCIERENRLRLSLNLIQERLEEIDQALMKISIGTFGICNACGGEINLRRLEAYLTATLCVECQAAADKKIKR